MHSCTKKLNLRALKSVFSWDALLSVCSEYLFEQFSLFTFGNDNGGSKHSLYKRSYSFLALLFTLMAFRL